MARTITGDEAEDASRITRSRPPAPPGPARALTDLPGNGWLRWRPAGPVPASRGIHVVDLEQAHTRRVRVGALGPRALPAGRYLYVGSAQRHLPARLNRHAGRAKPRRWHVDHLAAFAPLVGAWILPGADRSWECRVAGALAVGRELVVPGFGASDCACSTHLLRVPVG